VSHIACWLYSQAQLLACGCWCHYTRHPHDGTNRWTHNFGRSVAIYEQLQLEGPILLLCKSEFWCPIVVVIRGILTRRCIPAAEALHLEDVDYTYYKPTRRDNSLPYLLALSISHQELSAGDISDLFHD